MPLKAALLAFLSFFALTLPLTAQDRTAVAARALLEAELRPLLQQPIIVEAIKAHNNNYPDPPSTEVIITYETAWWAEKTNGGGALIQKVNGNPASAFLRDAIDRFGGKYTEFLIMGRHGFLVAQSAVASDHYQGDEPKYKRSYPRGADAVFVDNMAFDQSVSTVQIQVSFTLVDPDNGEPIGAATVGIRRGVLPGR